MTPFSVIGGNTLATAELLSRGMGEVKAKVVLLFVAPRFSLSLGLVPSGVERGGVLVAPAKHDREKRRDGEAEREAHNAEDHAVHRFTPAAA